MKSKNKKILSISLISFLVAGVISLVVFYNINRFDIKRERLEARKQRYLLKHGEQNNEINKLQIEKFEKKFKRYESRFIIWQLIFPLFTFAIILGVYFLIRNKSDSINTFSNKSVIIGSCNNCNSKIEKNWNTCPYCGHKYKN